MNVLENIYRHCLGAIKRGDFCPTQTFYFRKLVGLLTTQRVEGKEKAA